MRGGVPGMCEGTLCVGSGVMAAVFLGCAVREILVKVCCRTVL